MKVYTLYYKILFQIDFMLYFNLKSIFILLKMKMELILFRNGLIKFIDA